MGQLTLGSLFDGIGGFPFVGELSGITPLWAAEVEPLCVAVTYNRFPDMKHYGDVSKISGVDLPPVDIITFGSPCQDLSIAGKRKGLDGERSKLFNEAIRIIYEMRKATNGQYPTFIVWENVPGAYSSHKGHDFKTVLSEITQADISMPESGRWANAGVVRGQGICAAWRTLDAQYWGVPQRRKRIYLIGSFGSDCAKEILFKPDSVRRYLTPCGTQGKEIARDTGTGTTGCDYIFDARGNGDGGVAPTIIGDHNNRITDYSAVVLHPTYAMTTGSYMQVCEEISPTLQARDYKDAPIIFSAGFLDKNSENAHGIGYEDEVSPTLRAGMIPSTIYSLDCASFNQGENAQYDFQITNDGKAPTQVAKGPSAVAYEFFNWIVRRLIPLECERLQGYPNYWTVLPKIDDMSDSMYEFFLDVWETDKKINGKRYKKLPTKPQLVKWYNKLDSDSRRYKALGNSLAIPCAYRVIRGIAEYIREEHHD